MAVFLADDNILRNVNKTSGEVTRVRSTQSGIGKTFTRAAGGDVIFKNIQAFTVVGSDGNLDNLNDVFAISPRIPAS